MPSQIQPDVFANLIDKALIYLGRPAVQAQIIAALVALACAWLAARAVIRYTRRHSPEWRAACRTRRAEYLVDVALELARWCSSIVLGLAAVALVGIGLQAAGQPAGVLEIARMVLDVMLAYRIILALLYSLVSVSRSRYYHHRLLMPMVVCLIVLVLLDRLAPLDSVSGVVVVTLFDNPITAGGLFMATAGLYLWLMLVAGIIDLVYHAIIARTSADPGRTLATMTLIRYALAAVGIVVALNLLNLDPTALTAITAGLSVGIGFGLQQMVTNFFGGILLLTERTLRPGDVIDVQGELGVVQNLNIRATTVKTLDNIEIVIPNSTFMTGSFTTYTGSDRSVQVSVSIGAAYGHEPEDVIQVLLTVAKQHPEVATQPSPQVLLKEYGESSVNFQLLFTLADPMRARHVKSDINRMIWKAFAEHGIQIPCPQRDVHIVNWPAARPARKSADSPVN